MHRDYYMPNISGHELEEMMLHIGTSLYSLLPPIFYFCYYQRSYDFR